MTVALVVSPTSDLLTREQAAAYLGLEPRTLAVWASTGRYQLPMVKCGRLVRYRKADIENFIARRTVSSTKELAA